MSGAADRLARYGWRVLLAALLVAVIGGIVASFIWEPGAGTISANCPSPPCAPESLPGLRDFAKVLPILGQLLAILLGVPSAIVGGRSLLRGRPSEGGRRLAAFVGPVLVLLGTEILPHVATIGLCVTVPEICSYSPERGSDISDRWHPLGHALLGAFPMTLMYWRTRRT